MDEKVNKPTIGLIKHRSSKRKTKSKKPRKLKRPTTSLSVIEPNDHVVGVPLENIGMTDCFLIAVLNILKLVIGTIVVDLTNESEIIQEMWKVFRREVDNVVAVRRLFTVKEHRTGFQDIETAFDQLIEPMTKKCKEQFKLTCFWQWIGCKCLIATPSKTENFFIHIKRVNGSISLSEVLSIKTQNTKICNVCGCQQKRACYYQPGTFMMLRLKNTEAGIRLIDENNNGCIDVPVKPNESIPMRVKAFIEYIPYDSFDYGSGGHYSTWIRENNTENWTSVNDSKIIHSRDLHWENHDCAFILLQKL